MIAADHHFSGTRPLLVCHFLSAWGNRQWEFAVPLTLASLFGSPLAPAAAFSICVFGSCVFTGPALGAWIDRSERLWAVRVAMSGGAACIGVTCLLLVLLTAQPTDALGRLALTPSSCALFAALVAASAAAEALSQAEALALTRDWVVQIARGDAARLGALNARMQQLDLGAKVFAPALLGGMLAAVRGGPHARVQCAAAMVGCSAVCLLPAQLSLLARAHAAHASALLTKAHVHTDGTRHAHVYGARRHAHPHAAELASFGEPTATHARAHAHDASTAHAQAHAQAHAHGDQPHWHAHDEAAGVHVILTGRARRRRAAPRAAASGGARGAADALETADAPPAPPPAAAAAAEPGGTLGRWAAFFRHPVAGASVGYCLLYCTVLDNGALVTAYLQWRGLSPAALGLARTADALAGLAGTLVARPLARALGGSIERAALVSVWALWLALAPAGLLFAWRAGDAGVSDAGLLVCMTLGRAPLWSFDLAHTQVMQERADEARRGALNGCQASLAQACFVGAQASALALRRPEQFGALLGGSLAAVLGAALLYTRWCARALAAGGVGDGAGPPVGGEQSDDGDARGGAPRRPPPRESAQATLLSHRADDDAETAIVAADDC